MRAIRNSLFLKGHLVGFRYTFNLHNTYLTRDVGLSEETLLSKNLMLLGVSVRYGKDYDCAIYDDEIRVNRYEKVEGLNSKSEVESFTNLLKDIIGKYSLLNLRFDSYIGILRRELKDSGLGLGESYEVDTDSLCFSCRFLGGYSAWSGSEDLCDADTLDNKTIKKIVSVKESVNKKLDENHKVSWTTGEKAWTYFYFEIK